MMRRTQPMMGTLVSITLPAKDQTLFDRTFEEIKSVDKALSTYDEDAEIYRLNYEHVLKPSVDVLSALRLSEYYYKMTDGYFDVTIGSVLKKGYRFGLENERIPTDKQLQQCKTGWQGVTYGTREVKTEKGIVIDFGGMGKGFAVDKAAAFLKRNGVKEAVIAASGDIRCLGQCTVHIQSPFDTTVIASFQTAKKESAVSTSGIYERFVNTQKHNHLIDPNTKKPQNKIASVTLISDIGSSDLDAYATAVSVMPRKKALELLERLGIAYLFIYRNGNILQSDNIGTFVLNLTLLQEAVEQKEKH